MGVFDLSSFYFGIVLLLFKRFFTCQIPLSVFVIVTILYSASFGIYFPHFFFIIPSFSLALLLGRFHPYIMYSFLSMGVFFVLLFVYDFICSTLLVKKEPLPSPLDDASEIDVMLHRKSVRTYQNRTLTKPHRQTLLRIISEVTSNKEIRIEYLPKNLSALMITGTREFLVVVMPKKYTNNHVVEVGRCLQKVVLKLTRMGIATCWIGGFVGSTVSCKMENFDESKDHIAILCAVGYSSKYKPLCVKFQNMLSRTRRADSEFFFDEKYKKENALDVKSSDMKIVFEVTKWAPSASNEQGTVIVKSGNSYHFFKIGKSFYYSVIGVGISMTNWEAACEELKFEGHFYNQPDDVKHISVPKGVEYLYSWMRDE